MGEQETARRERDVEQQQHVEQLADLDDDRFLLLNEHVARK